MTENKNAVKGNLMAFFEVILLVESRTTTRILVCVGVRDII